MADVPYGNMQIIPMDIKSIFKKLQNHEYIDVKSMFNDLNLIFDNLKYYPELTNDVLGEATALAKYCSKLIHQYFPVEAKGNVRLEHEIEGGIKILDK